MNTTAKLTEPAGPSTLGRGSFFDLQLRIARRSDALARGCTGSRMFDRKLWLRAEQEILESMEGTGTPIDFQLAKIPAAECRVYQPAIFTRQSDESSAVLDPLVLNAG